MRASPFSPRAGALLLAFTLGCASGGAATRTESRGLTSAPERASVQPQAGAAPVCPMSMPGVEVSSEDTADGAAVRFSLRDEARVEALRASVRDMWARQQALGQQEARGPTDVLGTAESEAHWCPACPGYPPVMAPPPGLGPGTGTGGSGIEGVTMPAAQLQVEDTGDGARVLYVPEDPAQVDALRDAVRAHVVQVQAGECPMLAGGRR